MMLLEYGYMRKRTSRDGYAASQSGSPHGPATSQLGQRVTVHVRACVRGGVRACAAVCAPVPAPLPGGDERSPDLRSMAP